MQSIKRSRSFASRAESIDAAVKAPSRDEAAEVFGRLRGFISDHRKPHFA